jgi:hypothetical protein
MLTSGSYNILHVNMKWECNRLACKQCLHVMVNLLCQEMCLFCHCFTEHVIMNSIVKHSFRGVGPLLIQRIH